MLPTMFTLGNLVCGFFAIVLASRVGSPISKDLTEQVVLESHDLMLAGWLIFLAMLFDALDGYVARLSNTSSDFGAQLDSLCDLVTFGVAPGFLLVKMCPGFAFMHKEAVWVIAAAFAACAALRLARFNVETGEEDDHLAFNGLPSPAAAASIAGCAIMFYTLRKADNPLAYREEIDMVLQNVLPFFAVAVALLMVSRVPYPHISNQILRGQKTFRHLVAVIFTIVALMVIRDYSIPIACCAFAMYGPGRLAWEKVVRHKEQKEPIF